MNKVIKEQFKLKTLKENSNGFNNESTENDIKLKTEFNRMANKNFCLNCYDNLTHEIKEQFDNQSLNKPLRNINNHRNIPQQFNFKNSKSLYNTINESDSKSISCKFREGNEKNKIHTLKHQGSHTPQNLNKIWDKRSESEISWVDKEKEIKLLSQFWLQLNIIKEITFILSNAEQYQDLISELKTRLFLDGK